MNLGDTLWKLCNDHYIQKNVEYNQRPDVIAEKTKKINSVKNYEMELKKNIDSNTEKYKIMASEGKYHVPAIYTTRGDDECRYLKSATRHIELYKGLDIRFFEHDGGWFTPTTCQVDVAWYKGYTDI